MSIEIVQAANLLLYDISFHALSTSGPGGCWYTEGQLRVPLVTTKRGVVSISLTTGPGIIIHQFRNSKNFDIWENLL
jgi:hypothetical protein